MNLNNETDYKKVSNCLNDMIDIVVKKEKKRLYNQQYRQNNKEKLNLQKKQYWKDNKEKFNEQNKQRYQDNKEEYKEKIKLYQQTPLGKKSKRISTWKRLGLKCDDYDAIYDRYINTTNCDDCKCILTIDRYNTYTTKCMDHDHETGFFRNILCNLCNIKKRK